MSVPASRVLSLAVQRGLLDPRLLDERKAARLLLGESLSDTQWEFILRALIEDGNLMPGDVARLRGPVENQDLVDTGEVVLTPEPPAQSPASHTAEQILNPAQITHAPARTQAIPDPAAGLSPTLLGLEARVREEASAAQETLPMPGWARYELIRLMGSGGMGKVYAAKDRQLDRLVAIKFLHFESPKLLERFQQEARSQARLDHPSVCRVYEVGEVEGRPYIAMQLIDGPSIDALEHEMTLEQKAKAIGDVALALHEAHRLGIIHRDVKPSNILVERRDGAFHPIIMDFGLAHETEAPRLTQTGMIMGTPAYMPPEMVRADKGRLDRRADVYSLGATFYELVTGQTPFEGTKVMDVLMRTLEEEAKPPRSLNPALPLELDLIIMKCLEKELARRYDSARALAEDLQRFLDGEGILATKTTLAQRAKRFVRRNKAAAAVGGIGALALLVLLGFWAWATHRSRLALATAQAFGQEVQALEGSLRTEALLPLHDTSPARRQNRTRMHRIETQMAELGIATYGPGHYALGRGYLSLGDPATARLHLDQAWSSGYRNPDVALALGDAYLRLYQRAKEETRAMSNAALREARLKALDPELRGPALNFLSLARASTGQTLQPGHTPEMLQAYLALLDEHYDEALRRARGAQGALPGHFEAFELEGKILMDRAQLRLTVGNAEAGLTDIEAAGKAYATGLEIARSAATLFEAEASRQALLMLKLTQEGQPIDEQFAQAMAAADRALLADPTSVSAQMVKMQCMIRMSEKMLDHRADPRPLLLDAVDAGKKALEGGSDDGRAHQMLGVVFDLLGNYSVQARKDPMLYFNASVDHLRQALKLRPGMLTIYNTLGNTLGDRAHHLTDTGRSGREDSEESIRLFEQAITINPKYVGAHQNLASTHYDMAIEDRSRGVDPGSHIQKAKQAIQQALLINPSMSFAFNTLSILLLLEGEDAHGMGKDPSAPLKAAMEAQAKLKILNKDFPPGLYNEGLAHRELASYLFDIGLDPTEEFRHGQEAFSATLKASPDYANAWLARGVASTLMARHHLYQNRAADAALAAARSDLDHARKLTPDHPDLAEAEADWNLTKAFALRKRGGLEPFLLAAEEALRQGLRLNPKNADLHRMAGLVAWSRACAARSAQQSIEAPFQAGLRAVKTSTELNARTPATALVHALLLRLARDSRPAGEAELRQTLARNPFLKREAAYLDSLAEAVGP